MHRSGKGRSNQLSHSNEPAARTCRSPNGIPKRKRPSFLSSIAATVVILRDSITSGAPYNTVVHLRARLLRLRGLDLVSPEALLFARRRKSRGGDR